MYKVIQLKEKVLRLIGKVYKVIQLKEKVVRLIEKVYKVMELKEKVVRLIGKVYKVMELKEKVIRLIGEVHKVMELKEKVVRLIGKVHKVMKLKEKVISKLYRMVEELMSFQEWLVQEEDKLFTQYFIGIECYLDNKSNKGRFHLLVKKKYWFHYQEIQHHWIILTFTSLMKLLIFL